MSETELGNAMCDDAAGHPGFTVGSPPSQGGKSQNYAVDRRGAVDMPK